MSKRNRRRANNYKQLRAVGFNAKEANRFKDMSKNKIAHLVKQKDHSNNIINEIVGGKQHGVK